VGVGARSIAGESANRVLTDAPLFRLVAERGRELYLPTDMSANIPLNRGSAGLGRTLPDEYTTNFGRAD